MNSAHWGKKCNYYRDVQRDNRPNYERCYIDNVLFSQGCESWCQDEKAYSACGWCSQYPFKACLKDSLESLKP